MAEVSVTKSPPKKAAVKKIKKACRSCGKTRNLTTTDCCNNWICDDSISYRKGFCNWEHSRYSCCNYHYNQGHEGELKDCQECIKMGLSEYEFDEVTCVSCGFKSMGMNDFAFQLNEDFYCTKDECQAKGKPPPSKSAKKKVEIKKVSRGVVKRVKRACRSCGKTQKLTKTECCNNWICNDAHKYRLFSFALNSCWRNHHRYSSCSHHHNEKHEGKWQDCEECKENPSGVCSDFDEVTCVSCGFKSETMENFAFQIKKEFYCKKAECQKMGKPPPPKGKVVVKKIKRACCLCRKTKKLTKTECCNNWICNDSHKYRLFSFALNSCWRNHHRYSCCSYHHIEKHEGKWQDCKECTEMGPLDYDLEDKTCVSCGFKSQTMGEFAFQVKKDYYCKKVECQKKGKQPPSKGIKRKAVEKKVGSTEVKKAKRDECPKGGKPPPSKGIKRKAVEKEVGSAGVKKAESDECIKLCKPPPSKGTERKAVEKEVGSTEVKKEERDECLKLCKPPPSKGTERKAVEKEVGSTEVKKEERDECLKLCKPPPSKVTEVKKANKACRLCGKAKKLTKTKCCSSWICDDSPKSRLFSIPLSSCYQNHDRYSCCAFHHSQGHEGKAQDCEKCKKLGSFNFDFDDFETSHSNFEQENVDVQNIPKSFTCVCCEYTSETVEAFAFQLNNDFYCTKEECQKKGKVPLSEN